MEHHHIHVHVNKVQEVCGRLLVAHTELGIRNQGGHTNAQSLQIYAPIIVT